MLPDFLVIGSMKAGTTSLWRYLRAHPGIFMPDLKEAQFFSEHEWWRGLDWYESLFAAAPPGAVRGEASPSYTRFPHSAEARDRIAEHVPDAKLLYVVRHPVERIVSQYHHHVDQGREARPIDEAVLDEDLYVSTSRYAMQADRYLAPFPKDRLLVFTTEALDRDRDGTMRMVFDFLGVDADVEPAALQKRFGTADDRRVEPALVSRLRGSGAFRRIRSAVPERARAAVWRAVSKPKPAAAARPALSPEVEAELVERLRPDLERLPDLVSGDFDVWGLLSPASPRSS